MDEIDRPSGAEMDQKRQEQIAYEYLCFSQEAKLWIEVQIQETLPKTTEFEESLRNGVVLAKLGHSLCPDVVPLNKIYDPTMARYKHNGLHFRHTDNISFFLKALEKLEFSNRFWPETTDIYDKKNMPRVIYCIHALSHFLFKQGKSGLVQNLYGKLNFSQDELDSIRNDFSQHDVQMPAFSKIGGLLASDLPVKESDLHDSILAINTAIESQNPTTLLSALQNKTALLVDISPNCIELYAVQLYAAKSEKLDASLNRSSDPNCSLTPDVYDDLLTQSEIQGIVLAANMNHLANQLVSATERHDIPQIMTILTSGSLDLVGVSRINKDWYFIVLEKDVSIIKRKLKYMANPHNGNDFLMLKEELQNIVHSANNFAARETAMTQRVYIINRCLEKNDPLATFEALSNPDALLPQGFPQYAAPLIHLHLQSLRTKNKDVEHDTILSALELLKYVIKINNAIDINVNQSVLMNLLTHEDCCLVNVNPNSGNKYFNELSKMKESKQNDSFCSLLIYSEIQQVINDTNVFVENENARLDALVELNTAIEKGSHKTTFQKLQQLSTKFIINEESSELYQLALNAEKNKKKGEDLWINDVRDIITTCNDISTTAHNLGLKLGAVNLAIEKQDSLEIFHYLTNKDMAIQGVIRDCKELYLQRIQDVRRFKVLEVGKSNTGWLHTRLPDVPFSFYFNVKDRRICWSKPQDPKFAKDPSILNRDELQAVIKAVNADYDREMLFLGNEHFVVRLQAQIKGYLVRSRLQLRLGFYRHHVTEIVRIQSWWRCIVNRRRYQDRLAHFHAEVDTIVCLQSYVRMWLVRRDYLHRLAYFRAHECDVIRIQSFWRSCRARHDYRCLVANQRPPLFVVKKFLPLLENSYTDYHEEIELEQLKQQISNAIRMNRGLEKELRHMDLQIGLLVRNRISLQEVLTQNLKLKTLASHSNIATSSNSADTTLRALNKASQDKLQAYQHLFYHLQTHPVYMANLIYEMPQNLQTRFVETVIFSLYNYGSTARDEFLLLNLFKTAVELEIMTKLKDHPSDFLSANPFVIRLIIGLCRTAHAQASLKALLQPLIRSFLDDVKVTLSSNPVEVYKSWINKIETESGLPCGLPYEVNAATASEHPEVRQIIDDSLVQLRQSCQRFLKAIIRAPDRLPYSLRYMAKVIKNALTTRFPHFPQKDILKVVGNLIYYRYINSAIVAPDAFDILDSPRHISPSLHHSANSSLLSPHLTSGATPSTVLSAEKRRNLASVAKILQFATANRGFGDDSPHLAAQLNPFIRECHEACKTYFLQVCDVADPQQHFNMDQYTDLVSVTKPTIHMSIKEIRNTHALLLQYEDAIAPSHHDPLHEILEDLGSIPPPSVVYKNPSNQKNDDIQVDEPGASGDSGLVKLFEEREESYEVCLTLEPKDDTSLTLVASWNPGDAQMGALFIRTKRLTVDFISCLDSNVFCSEAEGADLVSLLHRDSTRSEVHRHTLLVQKRFQLDRSITSTSNTSAGLSRSKSVLSEVSLPLTEKKTRILSNLTRLETAGLVSRQDKFQALLSSIVGDIRHLRSYRAKRKQEVAHLRSILSQLMEKYQFQTDQFDYYNKYCISCMHNMEHHKKTKRPPSVVGSNNQAIPTRDSTKHRYRYTAAELRKKGVVVEVEGLVPSQYKNLQLEISRNTTWAPGTFEVMVSYLGMPMDQVQLSLNDLLQLQYEGTAVMTLFTQAKINVNLLLFLLNKKFYSKK